MTKLNVQISKIELDEEYFNSKAGLLNAIVYACSEYLFKIIGKHNGSNIKWFDPEKQRKLKRTIIHKNAHLDEYFAELLFRAILPKHLKDIDVYEHILMSKEEDVYAKISFPNAVVFGIKSDEAGGAKALKFFDEHSDDGTRISASCSQLVADEFLGNKIPSSIKKVLEEVNYSDSYPGAHQYHIKNVLFALNNVFFLVGKNEIENSEDSFVYKMLSENWKRAISNACIVSFIHAFENGLLKGFPKDWSEDFKNRIEKKAKRSLDRFLEKTYLKETKKEPFMKARGKILNHFRVWKDAESGDKNYHNTINGAFWKDKNTSGKIESQVLLLQPLCYALENCWGEQMADFIMFHLWQSLFQLQTSFEEVKEEISNLAKFKEINGIDNEIETCFGSLIRKDIPITNFIPEKKATDKTNRSIENITHFQIYCACVTNPNYSNIKQVLSSILNERNGGFGLLFVENKLINSIAISRGNTMPYDKWVEFSNRITTIEPECWFQLQPDGKYADFLLNRTEAHQDQLPSEKVNIGFITAIMPTL